MQRLNNKQQEKLLTQIIKEDIVLCDRCLYKDVKKGLQKRMGDRYWYIYDTGVCQRCRNTNDVVYVPYARFLINEEGVDVRKFVGGYPRYREGIMKKLLVNMYIRKRD